MWRLLVLSRARRAARLNRQMHSRITTCLTRTSRARGDASVASECGMQFVKLREGRHQCGSLTVHHTTNTCARGSEVYHRARAS